MSSEIVLFDGGLDFVCSFVVLAYLSWLKTIFRDLKVDCR